MSLSKTMLIGNLGDDVKLHHFDNGGCIGRFPLATNETYTKKDSGEKVTEKEWHNIVVRNKQAEVIEKYVKKGDQIYVEGKNKTRKWTDDKGQERYSTEVHVFAFTFLSNNKSEPSNAPQQAQKEPYNKAGDDFLSQGKEEQDDLPF